MAVMYEVPSRKDVARVVITEDVVHSNVNPTLVPADRAGTRAGRAEEGVGATRTRRRSRPCARAPRRRGPLRTCSGAGVRP